MNIEFLHQFPGVVQAGTEGIRIPVRVDGKRVHCEISREALEDHFGATGRAPQLRMDAFEANRPAIEAIAASKLKACIAGPVLLRTEDF